MNMLLHYFTLLLLLVCFQVNAKAPPACLLACVSKVIKEHGGYTFNQRTSICSKLSLDIEKCFTTTCPHDNANAAITYLKSICSNTTHSANTTQSSHSTTTHKTLTGHNTTSSIVIKNGAVAAKTTLAHPTKKTLASDSHTTQIPGYSNQTHHNSTTSSIHSQGYNVSGYSNTSHTPSSRLTSVLHPNMTSSHLNPVPAATTKATLAAQNSVITPTHKSLTSSHNNIITDSSSSHKHHTTSETANDRSHKPEESTKGTELNSHSSAKPSKSATVSTANNAISTVKLDVFALLLSCLFAFFF